MSRRLLAMLAALAVAALGSWWWLAPHGPPPGGRPRVTTPFPIGRTAGEKVFIRWCYGCHEPVPGHGVDPPAGTFVLSERYKGSSTSPVLADRTDLDPAYIRAMVRIGARIMPPFRKTEVTDQDLDALVVYLTRNNPE